MGNIDPEAPGTPGLEEPPPCLSPCTPQGPLPSTPPKTAAPGTPIAPTGPGAAGGTGLTPGGDSGTMSETGTETGSPGGLGQPGGFGTQPGGFGPSGGTGFPDAPVGVAQPGPLSPPQSGLGQEGVDQTQMGLHPRLPPIEESQKGSRRCCRHHRTRRSNWEARQFPSPLSSTRHQGRRAEIKAWRRACLSCHRRRRAFRAIPAASTPRLPFAHRTVGEATGGLR